MNETSRATAITSLLLATCLSAQGGSFTSLGVGILPDSVTDNGAIVAGDDGTSLTGSRVFQLAFVPSPLLGAPGVYTYIQQFSPGSYIFGIIAQSADGSRIARNMEDSGEEVAGRWDTTAQTWFSLGFLPLALACPSRSSAYDISDDGSVIVGLSWEGCRGRAFRWTLAGGMVALTHIGDSARASAVSGDGRTVGGFDHHPQQGVRRASVWFPDARGQQIILQGRPENPEGFGEVWSINRDGSVAVGWGLDTQGTYPFRWRNGTVTVLNIGGTDPRARHASDDGSLIVGEGGRLLPPSLRAPLFAWAWTQEDGTIDLESFLVQQGVTVPPGNPLTYVSDLTPDGRVLVGRRGIPLDPTRPLEGFVVELPPGRKYGIDAAKANTLDLAGSGSNRIGETFVATTSNLTTPVALTLVSAASSPPLPFLGGALLVNLAGPVVLAQATPISATTAELRLRIPNRAALVGGSVALQSIAPDSGAPSGVAFSNGLKLTIRG